jgi:hypothetical protein
VTIPARSTKVRGVGHFRDSYVVPRKQNLGQTYMDPNLLADKYQGFKGPVRVVNSISEVSEAFLSGQIGVPLHLVNPTNQPVTLRRGTRIAMVEAYDQSRFKEVEAGSVQSLFPTNKPKIAHE